MFSKSSVSSLVLAFLVSGFAQGCGGGDSASSASEPGQGGSGAGAASGAAGSSANAGAAGGTGNTGGAGSSSGAGASGNSGTAGDGGAGSSNGSSGNSGSAGNAGSAGGGGTAGNSGNGGSAGDGSTGGVGGAGASAGSSGGAGSAGMQQAPECQYAVPEPAPGAACQDVANYHAHVEHCSGGTPEQVSQKFESSLVACRKPNATLAEAEFIGAMNGNRRRIAQLVASGQMTPAGYLNRTWSNAAKTAIAKKNPSWMVEWLQGDDDGDFVPNTRDICPNTPELAATDLRGCVVDDSTVAHAPPADEVNAAIKLAGGLLYNEACKDAPIPNPPTPLRLHAGGLVSDPADMNSANTLLNFSMMPTNNQPADCPVYYELMANIEGLPGGSIVARRTFKASELPAAVGEGLPHVDYVSGAVAHCEFVRNGDLATEPRIPCTTAVGVPALKAVTLPAGVSGYWRVRAVNGAGVASPWSDLPVRQQTLYDQQ